MLTVGGTQPSGEPWPAAAGNAVPTDLLAGTVTEGQAGGESSQAKGLPGESVKWSAGATASSRSHPLGPVLLFVDPREARGDTKGPNTAARLGDALRKQPGESGESLLARTTQTLRNILQSSDLSDGDKGNLLAQAVDTLMSAGMSFKQETQALIARAKSERDRLDALLATIKA